MPMTNPNTKAVVLLSGGIDSTTTLALAQRDGFEVYALTFRYGQRHQVEIEAARRIARAFRAARHEIIDLDLRPFGGSALTDDIAVPKDRGADEIARGIPVTYVPARNTIFLSVALAASCYGPSPTGEGCGHCDACLLRLKGFLEAGAHDPVRYRPEERVAR